MNITKNLIDCIFLACLGFSCIAVGIYLALKNKKELCMAAISVACLSVLLSFLYGYEYYVEQQNMYCPNCNYVYKNIDDYDYCPECNAKLTNKCDSCNKYLPDSATDTCPYCGETINTKVGEIPESKKSSDEKQQYSKCPNCDKSLKDMKDIDNCPYCGFHLTHISTNKLTECQYCHRSLEEMGHIGDKCPYCGNKIEIKIGEIPVKNNKE